MNLFDLSFQEAQSCLEDSNQPIIKLKKKTQCNLLYTREFKERWQLTSYDIAFITGSALSSAKRWVAGTNVNKQVNVHLTLIDALWTERLISLFKLSKTQPVLTLVNNLKQESYAHSGLCLFYEVIIHRAVAGEYPHINKLLYERDRKQNNDFSWV